jgi:hypothetical protein
VIEKWKDSIVVALNALEAGEIVIAEVDDETESVEVIGKCTRFEEATSKFRQVYYMEMEIEETKAVL